MRLIKLYEEFHNQKMTREIYDICNKYYIENYTINEDSSIDVIGNVNLYNKRLTEIPLKFNKVLGTFNVRDNELTSLEGCPSYVGVTLCLQNNNLTSLEGCPKQVNDHFYCYSNKLTSLVGCPKKVGLNFYCYNNQIESFEGFPDYIGGEFNCDGNPIYELWILFEDYKHVELFNDLDIVREDRVIILQRLNEFLDMIGEPKVTSVKGYKCI